MRLIFSNFLRKKSLKLLLFLSIVSIFELKPSVASADVSVFIKRQIAALLIPLGLISVSFAFLYIVMKKITNHNRKPIIKEDAKQILNLKGDEKFIGEIHDGPRTIFNIIKHCNTFDSLDEKKEFLRNCHSNFIFHGPPGAGKNHAVLWLKYLLDEEGIKDVPFSVVKEVECLSCWWRGQYVD